MFISVDLPEPIPADDGDRLAKRNLKLYALQHRLLWLVTKNDVTEFDTL